jgi:hypothetical protein
MEPKLTKHSIRSTQHLNTDLLLAVLCKIRVEEHVYPVVLEEEKVQAVVLRSGLPSQAQHLSLTGCSQCYFIMPWSQEHVYHQDFLLLAQHCCNTNKRAVSWPGCRNLVCSTVHHRLPQPGQLSAFISPDSTALHVAPPTLVGCSGCPSQTYA